MSVDDGWFHRRGADIFALKDLVAKLQQQEAVTVTAGREFYWLDVKRCLVHRDMNLAHFALALNNVLSGLPIAVVEEFFPGAVNQQIQETIIALLRVLNGKCLLPPAKCRTHWHNPAQFRHFEQAAHHPGRLPK